MKQDLKKSKNPYMDIQRRDKEFNFIQNQYPTFHINIM